MQAIEHGKGVIMAHGRAIVHRGTYAGRSIIAKNSEKAPDTVDDRGYLPVEWWIMSKTEALNPVVKKGEGLTVLNVGDGKVSFKAAIEVAEKQLLGDHKASWPLTKILDIGGSTVSPSFGGKEVPPIPCHVHCGDYDPNCSACTGQGKLEAYFFPPLDVPP